MSEPGAGEAGEPARGAEVAARGARRATAGARRPKARRPAPPPGRDRRRSRWIQLRWALRLVLVLVLVWATLRMVRKLREQEARPPRAGDHGAVRVDLDGAEVDVALDPLAPSAAAAGAEPNPAPSAPPSADPSPVR